MTVLLPPPRSRLARTVFETFYLSKLFEGGSVGRSVGVAVWSPAVPGRTHTSAPTARLSRPHGPDPGWVAVTMPVRQKGKEQTPLHSSPPSHIYLFTEKKRRLNPFSKLQNVVLMSQHLSLPELPEVLYNPQTSNCLVPAASRESKAPTHLHLQHTDVIILHLVGDRSVQHGSVLRIRPVNPLTSLSADVPESQFHS